MIPAAWQSLIEGLLEAVWLVDPVSLRILALNRAAGEMIGVPCAELVGRPVVELTVTPEDRFFWEDAAAGVAEDILSETLMRSADGEAIAVTRRVSRVWPDAGRSLFLVGLRDLRRQRRTEDELERLVSELRATLQSTADGILVCDLQGNIRSYNRHFAALWQVPEDLLLRRDDAALFAHMAGCVHDARSYAERLSEIGAAPLLQATDIVLLGSGCLLERVSVPQYSRGQPTGRVYSFRDISLRVDAERRLALASRVFESSLDAIFITDAAFRILAVNPVCERLTDMLQADLVDTPAETFFEHEQDGGFFARIAQALQRDGVWQGEAWRALAGQPARAVQISWVVQRDADAGVTHTVCYFKDLTDRLAAQQRIEQLAYTDALTGLPNRLMLQQRAELAFSVADRSQSRLAIFFLDLDRFKNINDSMGHAFGDQVLVHVAGRLKLCLREVDTLCRLGGDEFVILLLEADVLGAEVVARRLLESLSLPFQVNGTGFSVGCSIGVALYPDDGKTLDELVQGADAAMYRVKERGRGSFHFYQPQLNADLMQRMKMDHAMRQAMEQDRFELHYQPQISLATGQLVGTEALIRWFDAELGQVSPALFIPMAEETGFIINIGNWVLEQAVQQAAAWQRAGIAVPVSVNVSALQFQQIDFVERVRSSLERAGLAAALLELELTESILLHDANEALARLHALAAIGVALSIDDFGTGYSSLGYLKKFPISKLKIDRSFVTGLPTDESDRAIVSATIGMARALKLVVVAEGVETSAQRDYLASIHCESFQGYLCSPGLPAPEFEQLMARLAQSAPD